MAKLNITDISNDFTKNPVTADISVKRDNDAIKQSLKNLMLLNKFDKPFNPDIDVGLREMLFENFPEPIRKNIIREKVEYIINKYEPRVQLQEVDVLSLEDENTLTIQITYGIANQSNLGLQSLQVNLERNR
jgi:phage baseplate assembly protein W